MYTYSSQLIYTLVCVLRSVIDSFHNIEYWERSPQKKEKKEMNHRGKQIDSGSGSGSGSGDNRRTYDCDICKRGFTNPQALGGHNNIHRRERERHLSSSSFHSFPFSLPLPPQSPSSSINFTNPNNNNPSPYVPTIESYHHQGSQPPINPSHNTQYFGSSSSSRGGGSFAPGEFHGLNLSLGLGSMNVDDDTHRSPPETGGSQPQDDDLDLDLRLGGHRHH